MRSAQQAGREVMRGACAAVIEHVEGESRAVIEDVLAVEEPLEIRLVHGPAEARRTKTISITMRTPGEDFELAVGFLLTEGVIADADDIDTDACGVEISGQNVVCVELRPEVEVKMASLERNFYVTSSCGVCGKASLLALQAIRPPKRENRFQIGSGVLRSLPAQLRSRQGIFERTGGLHAAGLFDEQGSLHALREDVGRHNAVDKLVGAEALAGRVPIQDRMLLLSGRASFELLQKAVMAGIPMVACVGAPSSLAVEMAQQFDVTLAGFLREEGFNIYHGGERIGP
jgi:FdhD protein